MLTENPKIMVRFPEGFDQKLEELRKATGAADHSEVLRNALLFYDSLIRERKAGKGVVVRSPDGSEYPAFKDE